MKPTCTCGECRTCKRRLSGRDRVYYVKNSERLKKKQKKYYHENRNEQIAWHTEYREKMRDDPEWVEKQRQAKKKWAEEVDYERTRRDKKKRRARRLFQQAVRLGKIKRQSCSVCGEENAEGHHEDYDKPYDVMWFCRRHHAEYEKSSK